MGYCNSISLPDINYLGLFDDISYKYVKDTLIRCSPDDEYVDVEIEDLECDSGVRTKFTFTLVWRNDEYSAPKFEEKTFEVIKEYNGSSPYALYIVGNLQRDDESDEDED